MKVKKSLIVPTLIGLALATFASPARAPLTESNFVAVYTAAQVLLAATQAISMTTTICEGLKTDKDMRNIRTRDKRLMAFSVATGAWGVVEAFADANAKVIREHKDDIDDEYYELSMEVIESVRKLAKSIPPEGADVDDILEALSSADRKVNQLLKRLDRYSPSPSGRRGSRNL